jgi:hypothetical protein
VLCERDARQIARHGLEMAEQFALLLKDHRNKLLQQLEIIVAGNAEQR